MDARLQAILRELRHALEALYGDRLVHLILFGSQARGDAGPDSDIDVLIVLKGPVDIHAEIGRTSHIIGELSLRHTVVLSRLFLSEDDYLHRHSGLLANLRREGVPV